MITDERREQIIAELRENHARIDQHVKIMANQLESIDAKLDRVLNEQAEVRGAAKTGVYISNLLAPLFGGITGFITSRIHL